MYEGTLISSTATISRNKEVLVVASLGKGFCGVITFDHQKNNDDFCTIFLTGKDQTSWHYTVSCPE